MNLDEFLQMMIPEDTVISDNVMSFCMEKLKNMTKLKLYKTKKKMRKYGDDDDTVSEL
jgi:hypothetical protein